jgi:hypothetical protein
VLASLGVDPLVQVVDDSRKGLLGLFVQVGNGDSGSENGVVGVLGGEVGSSLGSQILSSAMFVQSDSRLARQ